MPIHDWTRVDAGVFHDFHGGWIYSIRRILNAGLLPPDYYALAEQTTGRSRPDLLTLRLSDPPAADPGSPETSGGVAVTTAPPKVRFREQAVPPFTRRARSVVIRHVSGDRVVGMIEVVSPGNKGSRSELDSFVDKATSLIRSGIHLMILDLFPPGPRDPHGIHRAVWSELAETDYEPPSGQPLTFASYAAGPVPESFVEPAAVSDPVPEMPLFLTPDKYVPVPLEATYQAAWSEVPRRWQQALEPPARS